MKIAIIGYGKMGRIIDQLATAKGHEIVLKVDSSNAKQFSAAMLRKSQADVAIEFSTPSSALENIITCFEAGINVVSGTTAWLDQLPKALQHMKSNNTGFLYASNFSVGVNLFFAVNEYLAQLMEEQNYKVTVEETHHTEKLDAPSGTAITTAEKIIANHKGYDSWHLQEGDQKAAEKQLPITAKRQDPAPGTHVVKYTSEIDEIELTHTAKSRKGFALGAILAAEYMVGKKGLHSIKDVLQIK